MEKDREIVIEKILGGDLHTAVAVIQGKIRKLTLVPPMGNETAAELKARSDQAIPYVRLLRDWGTVERLCPLDDSEND